MACLLSTPHTQIHSNPFSSYNLFVNQQRSVKTSSVVVSCRATKQMGPEANTKNYYELLSLNQTNASMEEIKRAYRTLALRYHPDVCNPSMKEESTRIFVQLHAAYKTLSDPVLREEYDYGFGSTARNAWQEQIIELKRRSANRTGKMEGSWGCRMRARNIRKESYFRL